MQLWLSHITTMFILGHTSRLDYRSSAVGFIDLCMLITISGPCTITVILAYAPYALNGSDGPDGIGFDKDPATVGVAAKLARSSTKNCVTPVPRRKIC